MNVEIEVFSLRHVCFSYSKLTILIINKNRSYSTRRSLNIEKSALQSIDIDKAEQKTII